MAPPIGAILGHMGFAITFGFLGFTDGFSDGFTDGFSDGFIDGEECRDGGGVLMAFLA